MIWLIPELSKFISKVCLATEHPTLTNVISDDRMRHACFTLLKCSLPCLVLFQHWCHIVFLEEEKREKKLDYKSMCWKCKRKWLAPIFFFFKYLLCRKVKVETSLEMGLASHWCCIPSQLGKEKFKKKRKKAIAYPFDNILTAGLRKKQEKKAISFTHKLPPWDIPESFYNWSLRSAIFIASAWSAGLCPCAVI